MSVSVPCRRASADAFGYEYLDEHLEGDLTLPFVWLFGKGYLAPMLSAVGEFSGVCWRVESVLSIV